MVATLLFPSENSFRGNPCQSWNNAIRHMDGSAAFVCQGSACRQHFLIGYDIDCRMDV